MNTQPQWLSLYTITKCFGLGHHIRARYISALGVDVVAGLITFVPFWSMIYALLLYGLCVHALVMPL